MPRLRASISHQCNIQCAGPLLWARRTAWQRSKGNRPTDYDAGRCTEDCTQQSTRGHTKDCKQHTFGGSQ
eukprot:9465107-Alexandrium_andersonii.AAC.1